MFTELILAAFVSLLWHYHRKGTGPVFLLAPLMMLWVNLHQGFVAGLGFCLAYLGMELEETLTSTLRAKAVQRLRTIGPWLLAMLAATVVNPWGIRNYASMMSLMPVHSTIWLAELNSRSVTQQSVLEALSWRDPSSAVWWLVVAAVLALVAAVWQRKIVVTLLLGVSIYANFHSVRLAAPFAIIVAVVGGSTLSDAGRRLLSSNIWKEFEARWQSARAALVVLGVAAFVFFASARVWDLASDHLYMRDAKQIGAFGPGAARWWPDDAAAFMLDHQLPPNLFHDHILGGFVSWKLSPRFPDYIDGRNEPFEDTHFFRSLELLQAPLDSATWQQEVTRRDINSILISLDRVYGAGIGSLRPYCQSKSWRPVYLDTNAAVFVRRTPETESLLKSIQIDCTQVRFEHPPEAGRFFGKADQFNYHLNAAAILNTLWKPSEALQQLAAAEKIYDRNRDLHYMKGAALLALGQRDEGEKELRYSLEIEPYDQASMVLSATLREQRRYDEALKVVNEALKYSVHPHELYMAQGTLFLDKGMLQDALLSFDHAEATSPFKGAASALGAADAFDRWLADGRESAWSRLADMYETRGMMREAQNARSRALAITSSAPAK